jgi:hypothetical protein
MRTLPFFVLPSLLRVVDYNMKVRENYQWISHNSTMSPLLFIKEVNKVPLEFVGQGGVKTRDLLYGVPLSYLDTALKLREITNLRNVSVDTITEMGSVGGVGALALKRVFPRASVSGVCKSVEAQRLAQFRDKRDVIRYHLRGDANEDADLVVNFGGVGMWGVKNLVKPGGMIATKGDVDLSGCERIGNCDDVYLFRRYR